MAQTIVRTAKVAKWGNGAAIRIGAAALEQAHLHIDDPVDVIAHGDEIIIRKQLPKVTMADLLSQFDPATHRHDLAFDQDPAGCETR